MKKKGISQWISRLSTKLIIIYVLLAMINISIFILILFQNQAGLISENARFKAREIAENVYIPLNILSYELNSKSELFDSTEAQLTEVINLIDPILNKKGYVIVNQKGELLHQTSENGFDFIKSKSKIGRSILNLKAMGRMYLADFVEDNNEIIFYVPVRAEKLNNPVLIFSLGLDAIDKKLIQLYRLGLLIIGVVLLIQIILGFGLYQMIVKPIQQLHEGSIALGEGNFETRVDIKSSDEIGELGTAFNKMAGTIEDQIDQLQEKNAKMLQELELAGNVQKAIYPEPGESSRFDIQVYHKPLDIVSGDYHDICSLPDDRYGFLITDVSGHGVSAALITMLIKEAFVRYSRRFDNPRDLLDALNSNLSHLMQVYHSFFTAFYCILTKDNILLYSCAGHYEMYLLQKATGRLKQLYTSGIMLGMTKESHKWLKQQEIKVERGDRIILYTDGIIDNKDSRGRPYEITRFKEALLKSARLSCREMVDFVIADVAAYSKNEVSKDDQTLVIVEVKTDGPGA